MSAPVLLLVAPDCPNEGIRVTQDIVDASGTLRNMVEDFGGIAAITAGIPLANVSHRALAYAVVYVRSALDNPPPATVAGCKREPLTGWERAFFKVPVDQLYEILLTGNYLDIPMLIEATAVAIANVIKGRTPAELQTLLGIRKDFTPDEDVQLRLYNKWSGDVSPFDTATGDELPDVVGKA